MATEEGAAEKTALVRRVSVGGARRVWATAKDTDAGFGRRTAAGLALGGAVAGAGLGGTILTEEFFKHGSAAFNAAGDVWHAGALPVSFGVGAAAVAGVWSAYARNCGRYDDKEGFYYSQSAKAEQVGIPNRNNFRTIAVATLSAGAAAGLVAAGLDHTAIIGLADQAGAGHVLAVIGESAGAVGGVAAVTAARWHRRAQRQLRTIGG